MSRWTHDSLKHLTLNKTYLDSNAVIVKINESIDIHVRLHCFGGGRWVSKAKMQKFSIKFFHTLIWKPAQLHPSQRILLLQLEHKALWTGRAVTPANAMPQLSAILATPIENSLCSGLTWERERNQSGLRHVNVKYHHLYIIILVFTLNKIKIARDLWWSTIIILNEIISAQSDLSKQCTQDCDCRIHRFFENSVVPWQHFGPSLRSAT